MVLTENLREMYKQEEALDLLLKTYGDIDIKTTNFSTIINDFYNNVIVKHTNIITSSNFI
jgi:hypothetical protein